MNRKYNSFLATKEVDVIVINNREEISLGYNCVLRLDSEILIKDEIPIYLSRLQFKLLYYLSIKLGTPVSFQDLSQFVWGSSFITQASFYVNINRLRYLLEDNPKKPRCLITIYGFGYVLNPRQKPVNNEFL